MFPMTYNGRGASAQIVLAKDEAGLIYVRSLLQVIPLVAIVSAGCMMGISALVRVLVVHPDVR